MKLKTIKKQTGRWNGLLSKHAGEKYCLRLYVSGTTPKSTRAITNI